MKKSCEFLLTRYEEDSEWSDYASSLTINEVESMSHEELERLHIEANVGLGFPQASLSAGKVIMHGDMSWEQVDVFFLKQNRDLEEVKSKYPLLEKSEATYQSCPTPDEISWTEENIGGFPTVILHYPVDYSSETGECFITKGGSGGKDYFIERSDGYGILVSKQSRFENERDEDNFEHFIHSFILDEEENL